jgi:D-arabinose 1-dehydrogenase-like Zn-dependent alcohol dehydrogenase
MRAVRLVEIAHPLEMQDIPIPEVHDDQVLVRIRAAGICHSDVHYRAGTSPVGPLPLTLGHEIAGTVERAGKGVRQLDVGSRVCIHYLVTCGQCEYCQVGREQFCVTGQMVGKHRDGGYAEYIAVPARSVVRLPDDISFAHGAVMMCSSATSLHALIKSGLRPGERIAIFGAGGLGMSAIQLARAFGALDVFAVDIDAGRLARAGQYGAIAVDAARVDPVQAILQQTGGRGVDVSLELIGLPLTMRQAVQCLAIFGRMALVGITDQLWALDAYREVLGKEVQIIGSSDHLFSELPLLFEYAQRGILDLGEVITSVVPLNADAINARLDNLERFGAGVRSVIVP